MLSISQTDQLFEIYSFDLPGFIQNNADLYSTKSWVPSSAMQNIWFKTAASGLDLKLTLSKVVRKSKL